MQDLKLEIRGMTCGHCVGAVRSALTALPGVEIQDVQVGAARVTYDEGVVTAADVERAVTATGYTAAVAK